MTENEKIFEELRPRFIVAYEYCHDHSPKDLFYSKKHGKVCINGTYVKTNADYRVHDFQEIVKDLEGKAEEIKRLHKSRDGMFGRSLNEYQWKTILEELSSEEFEGLSNKKIIKKLSDKYLIDNR